MNHYNHLGRNILMRLRLADCFEGAKFQKEACKIITSEEVNVTGVKWKIGKKKDYNNYEHRVDQSPA